MHGTWCCVLLCGVILTSLPLSLSPSLLLSLKFLGNSAKATCEGGSLLTFRNRGKPWEGEEGSGGERYGISIPSFYARGVLVGKLRLELGDTSCIIAHNTGMRADFEFFGKPVFRGKDRMVKGTVRNTITGKVLYSIEGQWDAAFTIKDCREGSNGAIRPFVDVRFYHQLGKCGLLRRFTLACVFLMVCTTNTLSQH